MKILISLVIIAISLSSQAQVINGISGQIQSLDQALAGVQAGDIVVLGEHHGTLEQATQQLQIIENIKKNGFSVSVGMEFFEYPLQRYVDWYKEQVFTEAEFLKQIKWGSFSFDAYREQVRAGEYVLALNAPRELTSRIAKVGLDQLTTAENSLLPPDFEIGNSRYFERFKTIMGSHLPSEEALGRYFAAQSTWDDTMAWRAVEFINQNPKQVLVIIVGEFHVQYGGGLPDRLKKRGASRVHSFSMLNKFGLSQAELEKEIEPSAIDGARADWIILSEITSP